MTEENRKANVNIFTEEDFREFKIEAEELVGRIKEYLSEKGYL